MLYSALIACLGESDSWIGKCQNENACEKERARKESLEEEESVLVAWKYHLSLENIISAAIEDSDLFWGQISDVSSE